MEGLGVGCTGAPFSRMLVVWTPTLLIRMILQARRLVRDSILGIERPQVDLDDQDWLEDLAQAEELAEAARQAEAAQVCCRSPNVQQREA